MVHRDLDIVAETLALWLRCFPTLTPPLPARDQESARLVGRERFDVFIKEIAGRKPSDARYLKRVVKLAANEGSGPRSGTAAPGGGHQKANPAWRPMAGEKEDICDTKNGG